MMRLVERPSRMYRFLGIVSRPLVYGLFRLEARGLERLPEGGFVLAANHASNLDPWALGIPLFPQRWLRFMAKSELYWWPLSGVLRAGGAFRVRRGAGEVVVMFPEGTRQQKGLNKKWDARPHTGAARIAKRAGSPLVPAAIKGTDRLARGARWKVVYGSPIEQGGDAKTTTRLLMS